MNFKSLTWQQVAFTFGLLLTVGLAYHFFGEVPAGIMTVITSLVALMLGRPNDEASQ